MRTFQSLEAIREAEVEELKKAPSMNEQSARMQLEEDLPLFLSVFQIL